MGTPAMLMAAFALSTVTLAAQNDRALDVQLVDAVRRVGPVWNVKDYPDDPHGGMGYKEWHRGNAKMSVSYHIRSTEAEASEFFRKTVQLVSVGVSPIHQLGDEAYLTDPSNPSGQRTLYLRAGRIVAVVRAPGGEATKALARLIVPELMKRSARG